jgi:hypothetical protein
MSDLLGGLVNYGSDCGNATEDDGGAGVSPSHASQSDMSNERGEHNSEDSEASEGSQEFSRTMQDASLKLRHKNIRKRKLMRLGYVDSDEEISDEYESELSPTRKRQKTPFRKLSMPSEFTPPRNHSKVLVRDSEDEVTAEDEDYVEEFQNSVTPKRLYHTNWVEVKRWSKSRMTMSEINREIDALLSQSLKNAGYLTEHVSKTKETDRAYWKEAHVSFSCMCNCSCVHNVCY